MQQRLFRVSSALAFLFSLSFVSALAFAQSPEDYLSPPKELSKLDFLLGTWTSSGTYSSPADPSGAKAPWTARSTVTKVLGGHYLQDDLVVEFEVEGIPPYVSRTYYGYDRDRGQFFTASADNSGRVGTADIQVEDGTIVSAMAFEVEGTPAATRTVTHVDGGEMEFANIVLFGRGGPRTEVEGKGKREGEPVAIGEREKAGAIAPPASEMMKLQRIAGTYRVKGSVVPFPGAPKMEIGAKETIEAWFGGSVLAMHVQGDESPGFPAFEGRAFVGWDASQSAYKEIVLDNMGGFSVHQSHLIDGAIVALAIDRLYGTPTISRSIVSLNEDGSIAKVVVDAMGPSGETMRAFDASYTKESAAKDGAKKDGAKKEAEAKPAEKEAEAEN